MEASSGGSRAWRATTAGRFCGSPSPLVGALPLFHAAPAHAGLVAEIEARALTGAAAPGTEPGVTFETLFLPVSVNDHGEVPSPEPPAGGR